VICAGGGAIVADITIIMDSTPSKGYKNWKWQRNFVGNLIRAFNIARDGVLVSVINYNRELGAVTREIKLSLADNVAELERLLYSIKFQDKARKPRSLSEVIERSFADGRGNRDGVLNYFLLMVDDQSYTDLSIVSDFASSNGIGMFLVGKDLGVSGKDQVLSALGDAAMLLDNPAFPSIFDLGFGVAEKIADNICASAVPRAAPIFAFMQCPYVEETECGRTRCSNDNSEGSVCTVECKPECTSGVLKNTATCQPNMKWSRPLSKCEVIKCPAFGEFKNGKAICTNTNIAHSECAFECDKGFVLIGDDSSHCEPDCHGFDCVPSLVGEWEHPIPTCQAVTCTEPTNLRNGGVTCSNGNLLGSTCTYSCDDGYTLSPPAYDQITCESARGRRGVKGAWDRKAPICRKLAVCTEPGIPYRGGRLCNGQKMYEGTTCTYSCESGYQLQHSEDKEHTCKQDGEWDHTTPCCITDVCTATNFLDLYLIVDSSSSVGARNWDKQIDFVRSLVDIIKFNVGINNVRIGFVAYSKRIHTEILIRLDETTNRDDFVDKIEAIKYSGRGTRTGQAIQWVVDHANDPDNRPNIPDMAIVITDGHSQDDVKKPSEALRQRAQVFAVGIGLKAAKGALQTIRDIGGHEHNSFNVAGGFDGLDVTARAIGDMIKHTACKACVVPKFDPKQGGHGEVKPFQPANTGVFYFPNGTVWSPPPPSDKNVFEVAIADRLEDLDH